LIHPLLSVGAFDQVWASHSFGGLFALPSPGEPHQPGQPFPRIFPEVGELRAVHPRRQGGLWLGTSNGLFQAGSPTNLERLTEFDFPGINALAEDRGTNLWIATGAGLFKFDTAGR